MFGEFDQNIRLIITWPPVVPFYYNMTPNWHICFTNLTFIFLSMLTLINHLLKQNGTWTKDYVLPLHLIVIVPFKLLIFIN